MPVVNRSWKKGDRIDLSLAMPTEVVAADPRVKADSGKLAVQRGPLVYCMEEADNAQTYDRAGINFQTRFTDKFMARPAGRCGGNHGRNSGRAAAPDSLLCVGQPRSRPDESLDR